MEEAEGEGGRARPRRGLGAPRELRARFYSKPYGMSRILFQALWDVPRETKSPPLSYENCLGYSVETDGGRAKSASENRMLRRGCAGGHCGQDSVLNSMGG